MGEGISVQISRRIIRLADDHPQYGDASLQRGAHSSVRIVARPQRPVMSSSVASSCSEAHRSALSVTSELRHLPAGRQLRRRCSPVPTACRTFCAGDDHVGELLTLQFVSQHPRYAPSSSDQSAEVEALLPGCPRELNGRARSGNQR